MEVLHTIELAKAPITLENIDWSDEEKRKAIYPQCPTGTLPCLCLEKGKISQSKAIEYYIAEKYKPELLGATPEEKAEVIQWMNFAMLEIYRCTVQLIYPIFGWKAACKEETDSANKSIKEYIKVLENHLNGKKYFVGDKLTLADVVMFFHLRYYFQYLWVDGMRKNMLKNTTAWFTGIMETEEAKKAYGRTLLCKAPLKVHVAPKKEEIKKEEKKKETKKEEVAPKQEKKVNPLDELPPSKLKLEEFKRAFLNNKDKEDAMTKFWETFDPEGYAIWKIEYPLPEGEGKVLFRTSNAKGFFLQKLDSFRKYCFAAHGVYGSEGNYHIKGVWMMRGKELPAEIKECDYYDYLVITKLDPNKAEDKNLVHDYWTKLNEEDVVEGEKAADVEYFQ